MQVILSIEILSPNHRTFELPIGFSARLHARLEQEIRDGGALSDAHSPAMSIGDGNTGYRVGRDCPKETNLVAQEHQSTVVPKRAHATGEHAGRPDGCAEHADSIRSA